MRNVAVLIMLCLALYLPAQPTFPSNTTPDRKGVDNAFIHATIHLDDKTILNDATLLVHQGRITAVGVGIPIPNGCVIHDLTGKHLYPSFVDLQSNFGTPKTERGEWSPFPQMERTAVGAFGWNDAIHADFASSYHYHYDEEKAASLIQAGFGSVLTHKSDGVVQGSGTLVALHDNESLGLLKSQVSAHYSFSKGSSKQEYPSSLMGSIALLRQTYLDAQWYKNGGFQEERNLSLESFLQLQNLIPFFETDDKWNAIRADKIGDEFGQQYIFYGSGNEYQRIEDIKGTGGHFVLPLHFPGPMDLRDPMLMNMVSLEEMKHWEWAPANAAILKKNGVPFVFTAQGLEDASQFLERLKKAAQYGLTESDIIAATATLPAQWIHAEDLIGSLHVGNYANFIVTNLPLLNPESKILDNYILGDHHEVTKPEVPSWAGSYHLNCIGKTNYRFDVVVQESNGKLTALWIQGNDTLQKEVKTTTDYNTIRFVLESNPDEFPKAWGLAAIHINYNQVEGLMEWNDGEGQKITGTVDLLPVPASEKSEEKQASTLSPSGKITYPFGAYGRENYPEQKNYLITNATLWTNEKEGVITGDVLIIQGKIAGVGKNITSNTKAPYIIIDGTGKHVTSGIIDEHSHIALLSVNEGAQSSSAEVEENRVVWSEDIDIYRQLAGGVTAAQLLHGSANAIGGQSALIKLRWGVSGDQMLIENAPKFIKFALGENVKHSNAGDFNRVRFPQTRMGVEQLYYDYFHRAKDYGEAWKMYRASSKTKKPLAAPRRDLEMETLLEILEGQRFITCHSYVQSEINMLMHVADSMGFKVNTFTHILEGYKVADKMKEHGVNASSFSDWWAYKMEVRDAIPYNGALLHNQGVVVAYNSDDAEMARRLNQEAAKAIKYGGLSEEDAWKFVTLNPAIMLHLNDRMGSLKIGKDADVVIWNDKPLSVYARVEKTFVDGRLMYDHEEEQLLQMNVHQEKERLAKAMMEAIENGDTPQKPSGRRRRHFHCDSEGSLFIYNDIQDANHH